MVILALNAAFLLGLLTALAAHSASLLRPLLQPPAQAAAAAARAVAVRLLPAAAGWRCWATCVEEQGVAEGEQGEQGEEEEEGQGGGGGPVGQVGLVLAEGEAVGVPVGRRQGKA